MHRKVSLGVCILSVLVAMALAFQVTALVLGNRYEDKWNAFFSSDQGHLLSKLQDVDSAFRSHYVGEISEEDLEYYLLQGYVYGGGDQYGQYLPAAEWESYQKELQGDYVGIGVVLRYNDENDTLYIGRINPGSPAEASGLQTGDTVLGIGDCSWETDGIDALYNASMEGGEGDTVSVRVSRNGIEHIYPVTLSAYRNITVCDRVLQMNQLRVGLIYVEQIETSTAEQFTEAVDRMTEQQVDCLVFDVRYNPGGDMEAILSMVDYLVPDGKPLAHLRGKNGETYDFLGEDGHSVDLPMAVLTSRNTASAAELFTAALLDYDMAISVGEKTYGKGCMQELLSLPDGSMLRVTSAYFDPPTSANFNGQGITPTVEVLPDEKTKFATFDLPAQDDNQLCAAVRALAESINK